MLIKKGLVIAHRTLIKKEDLYNAVRFGAKSLDSFTRIYLPKNFPSFSGKRLVEFALKDNEDGRDIFRLDGFTGEDNIPRIHIRLGIDFDEEYAEKLENDYRWYIRHPSAKGYTFIVEQKVKIANPSEVLAFTV